MPEWTAEVVEVANLLAQVANATAVEARLDKKLKKVAVEWNLAASEWEEVMVLAEESDGIWKDEVAVKAASATSQTAAAATRTKELVAARGKNSTAAVAWAAATKAWIASAQEFIEVEGAVVDRPEEPDDALAKT